MFYILLCFRGLRKLKVDNIFNDSSGETIFMTYEYSTKQSNGFLFMHKNKILSILPSHQLFSYFKITIVSCRAELVTQFYNLLFSQNRIFSPPLYNLPISFQTISLRYFCHHPLHEVNCKETNSLGHQYSRKISSLNTQKSQML